MATRNPERSWDTWKRRWGGRPVRGRVKTLVLTAVVAAMACAATLAVQIPSPTGGYLNLGDAVVLLGAYLLGPGWGAAAGAVGPALADLMTYPAYVPATLLIKAVMGLAAGALYSRLRTRGWGALVCGIVGEIPMVAGYWLYDTLLVGSLAGSAAGVPANPGPGRVRCGGVHPAGYGTAPQQLCAPGVSPAVKEKRTEGQTLRPFVRYSSKKVGPPRSSGPVRGGRSARTPEVSLAVSKYPSSTHW